MIKISLYAMIMFGVVARGSSQPHNDLQLEKLLPELSNWGVWGDTDELGTLNYLTDSVVLKASQEITNGHSISLARKTTLSNPVAIQCEYRMQKGLFGSRDFLGAIWHGFELTHIDALCHVFADSNQMYNGFATKNIREDGSLVLGIDRIASKGIVGRGVLVDVARYLPGGIKPGQAIYAIDLELVLEKQGTQLLTGDVLLIRTGLARQNQRNLRAGLHPSCLSWIKQKKVSLLGSDGDNDVYPVDNFDKYSGAFHTVGIPYLGLTLLDNAELESLGTYCHEQDRYTFFISISPWNITGATSSPVNPIAIF